MDDENLRACARDAIATGRLPAHTPVRTWAGKGSGATCTVCALPITADDVEVELEFMDTSLASPRCCRVHPRCFTAWELVRHRIAPGV